MPEMKNHRYVTVLAVVAISGLLATASAQDKADTKQQVRTMSTTTRVMPASQIVKQTTCPESVTVTSMQNLQGWTLPRQQAPYISVRIAERDMGGRKYVSTVCEYRAYNGRLSIERVMGQTTQLKNCRIYSTQGGTGGVQCS